MLESVSSEFIGQNGVIENNNFKDQIISSDTSGKIGKLRHSCDNVRIHNQRKTICVCTFANGNIRVPWKIKVDETIKVEDQIMKSSKLETNKNSEEMSRTISSNINRKIKKRRQGCDSFWMHNE